VTSYPVRDKVNDHLLTSKNAAMIFIDYQPTQISAVSSMDLQLLVDNAVRVAKMGKAFDLPIILSTVNVKGGQKPSVPPLKEVLSDLKEIDRTTINAWEDKEFLEAVEATGRKKLIMCALWTEACLIFPSLDALRDGYEVYPVVDAVGGTSLEAHQYALQLTSTHYSSPVRITTHSSRRRKVRGLGAIIVRASAGLGSSRHGPSHETDRL